MIIFLYTTNQHKKYDIFHVEHFSQNSKLILDRADRDYRALVKQLTALSTIAAPSAGTLQNLCTFGDGGERDQSFIKSAVNAVSEINQSLVSLPAFTALLLKTDRALHHRRP